MQSFQSYSKSTRLLDRQACDSKKEEQLTLPMWRRNLQHAKTFKSAMIKVLRRCLATQAVAVAVALRRRPSSQRSASPPSQARIDYMRSIFKAVSQVFYLLSALQQRLSEV